MVQKAMALIACMTTATWFIAGCGGAEPREPDEGNGGATAGEVLSKSQAALTTCSPATNCDYSHVLTYSSSNNDGFIIGPNPDDYLCWASTVASRDSPERGPHTEVGWINFTLKYWFLIGKGSMSCVKRCCFSSNGGASDVNWLSTAFVTDATNSGTSIYTNAWWGDAATIVQGFTAATDFNANKDVFAQYLTRTTPTRVWASAGTKTQAYSFFVGIPGGGHVRKVSGFFSVYEGSYNRQMIRTTDGICYFHSLGPLIDREQSSAERKVWISPEYDAPQGDYYWHLRTTSTDPSYTAPKATAECYYYNQSQ